VHFEITGELVYFYVTANSLMKQFSAGLLHSGPEET
jgi:hypothetical protein